MQATAATGQLATHDLPGAVPPASPAAGVSQLPAADPTIRLEGSVLTIDGRPFFARVIERRDESLEWLQKLGFNVIKLASPPTDAELAEAERFGLWLMAPPPVGSGPPPTTSTHGRVSGLDARRGIDPRRKCRDAGTGAGGALRWTILGPAPGV